MKPFFEFCGLVFRTTGFREFKNGRQRLWGKTLDGRSSIDISGRRAGPLAGVTWLDEAPPCLASDATAVGQ